jgi:hypothetical protein
MSMFVFSVVTPFGLIGGELPTFGRNIVSIFSPEDGDILCFSETLVSTYKSSWRRYPEEQHRYLRRRENPSLKILYVFLVLLIQTMISTHLFNIFRVIISSKVCFIVRTSHERGRQQSGTG